CSRHPAQTRPASKDGKTKRAAQEGSRAAPKSNKKPGLLLLLEQGQTGGGVFGNLVAVGKGVDRAFLGFAGEEIKGHLLAALQLLLALMQEVLLAGFLAGHAVGHKKCIRELGLLGELEANQ